MRPSLHLIATGLLVLAGPCFAAHAQQGSKPAQNGLERLKKEGRVSAKMAREDERAERVSTVRADGSMEKKPKFIREEDRFTHRKHPQKTSGAPNPTRPKHHTTLKG